MPAFPPLVRSTPERPVTVDRIVRKDIRSANWDGGGDLSGGEDTTATGGYLIDYATGAAQFQSIYAGGGSLGNLTVDDELTVEDYLTLSTGGTFRTAASGQRIELTSANKNYITFYTGDVAEEGPGFLVQTTSGSGVVRTLNVSNWTPQLDADDWRAVLALRSASPDGTSFAPAVVISRSTGGGLDTGLTPEFRIQNTIPLISDGLIQLQNLGTAAAPAIGWDVSGAAYDDGMYSPSAGMVAWTTAGVQRMRLETTQLRVAPDGNNTRLIVDDTRVDVDATFFQLPVKTTTGDPSSPAEGDTYVNTFDNAVRVYADAAWRDLVTW